jgi:hypothetical protein
MKVFLPPATSKTFLKTHLNKEETSGSFQLTLYELFGLGTVLAEVGNGRGCPVLPKSPTNAHTGCGRAIDVSGTLDIAAIKLE